MSGVFCVLIFVIFNYIKYKKNAELNHNLDNVEWFDEHQIGMFEGEPLFRKTIKSNMSSFVASSTYQLVYIPHGITGISKVIDIRCKLGAYYNTYFADGPAITYVFQVNKKDIIFKNKDKWGASYGIYATLYYTK